MLLLLVLQCCLPIQVCSSTLESVSGGFAVKTQNYRGGATVIISRQNVSRPWVVRLPGTGVKQVLVARLDGSRCVAMLTGNTGKALRLYRFKPSGLEEFWRGVSSSIRPWKVQIGDVDGDGKEEIAVGVYKKTRFHPVLANRPFIYGWNGKDIYPKWLGSRLAQTFTDFVLLDTKLGMRYVSVEKTRDGRFQFAVYKWNGFGFTGEWHGPTFGKLVDLSVSGPVSGQTVSVKDERGAVHRFAWDGTTLQPSTHALNSV